MLQDNENSSVAIPLLGHTNKINHLETVEPIGKMFSCSNDCTLRQWPMDNLGICERVFRF